MRRVLPVVLLLTVLLAMKLVHFSADAPARLTWSRSLYSDESSYAQNARSKILYGSWNTDTLFFTVVSPVMTVTYYTTMKLFGVSYASIRLVAIVCFFLTLLFLFAAVKHASHDFGLAFLTMGIVGLDFSYFFYTRHILLEIPVVLFLVITLYFLEKMTPRDALFAGVFTAAAYMTKPTYIVQAAVCLLALLSGPDENKNKPALVKSYLTGLIAALAVYTAVFLVPMYSTIQHLAKEHLSVFYEPPATLADRINRMRQVFDTEFLRLMPVTFLLSFLAILSTIRDIFTRKWKTLSFLERFSFLWIVVGFAFLTPWNYRPSRYYLHLVIPMSILAAIVIRQLFSGRIPVPLRLTSRWYTFFQLAVVYYATDEVARFYAPSGYFFNSLAHQIGLELFQVCALVSSYFVIRALSKSLITGRSVAVSLLALMLLFDVTPYVLWAARPQYRLSAVSRDLAATVPPKSVIAGPWAPALCFEHDLKPIAIMPVAINDPKDYFDKYGIQFLLLEDDKDELGMLQKKFPEVMSKALIVKEYSIREERILLYKLQSRADGTKPPQEL